MTCKPTVLLFLGSCLCQTVLAAIHPGMLHTNADFTRMATKVAAAEQPWKGSWDLLVASTNSQSTWNARPVSVINRGTSPDNCALLYNDAAAAYQNALRWKITGNVAHANKAVEILNAWGYSLTAITVNADRFLAAGHTAMYPYQMWTDATRYLSNVGGAVNAATVSGAPAQESATFAEVPANP